MQIKVNDYEYLKKIVEILRNQKIRIEDDVVLGQPVFKIILEDDEVVYFITRDEAKVFIEAHSTFIKKIIDTKYDEHNEERRKSNLMEVTINKNFEVNKIIDIIKRNY